MLTTGGGTAGLPLAARLSEDPDVTVVVLEAGGTNFDDPLLRKFLLFRSHSKMFADVFQCQ